MERIILIKSTLLCVAILLFDIVLSLPYETSVINEKDNDGKKQAYVWFGPRLEKKKRHSSNNDIYQNVQKDELIPLVDSIQDIPWSVIAVNEGKRHVVNFTPRLGRESGEEYLNSIPEDRWLQNHETSEELLYQRSPPFAPRLGRQLFPLSPRLGRDNDKLSTFS